MQRTGSPSWRFEQASGTFPLHAMLFVRDAAGLEVPPSAANPPPLVRRLDDSVDALSSEERSAAGLDWDARWRQLLELLAAEARQHERPADEAARSAWMQARWRRREELFDPPEFESLSGSPELRSAARAAWAAFTSAVRPETSDRSAEQSGLNWQLTSAMVTSVAAEHGVAESAIGAKADILDVEGIWSYLASPGYALCSRATRNEEASWRALLHDLFASSLS